MLKAISQDKLTDYCGCGKTHSLDARVVSITVDADSIIALGNF